MKKNIIKFFSSLFIVAVVATSCTEDEVLKSNYDYVPVPGQLPSLTASVSGDITGSSAVMSGTITFNGDTAYLEKGFVCATDVDFTKGVVSAKIAGANFSGTVEGLKELTSYYARGYVVTKNGVAYSDVVTFATPMLRNPLLDYVGSYVMSDYLYADEKLEAAYMIELVEIPGNIKQMKLVNFWDGGTEIIVDFNLATKTVSIANTQVIYVHSTYGNALALPWTGSATTNTPLTGTIGANGTITINSWAATVTAGTFGRYKYSTLVPATNTLAGVYTEVDYKLDGTIEATYANAIVIAPVAADLNKLKITNFWDGGNFTIEAIMNFGAKTFTIAPQIIYVDATHGNCLIYPFNVAGNAVDKSGAATNCTIVGDTLVVGSWAATVAAGTFGRYLKSTLVKGSAASIRASVKPVAIGTEQVKFIEPKSLRLTR